MANKEESTKKTKANKENSNTVIKETITYDNTPIFNKMLICLYIIIALLAINIIISAIKGSNNNYATSNNGGNQGSTNTSSPTNQTASYDVSKFKAINANEFIDAYKGSETQLIYLGSPKCGYCIKFVPVLTEVQEKYNFKTLYLDVSTTSNDDANKIIELNKDFFTGENTAYGFTPMTLIVKDNKIIDSQVGASNASTLEALVSKYFDKK